MEHICRPGFGSEMEQSHRLLAELYKINAKGFLTTFTVYRKKEYGRGVLPVHILFSTACTEFFQCDICVQKGLILWQMDQPKILDLTGKQISAFPESWGDWFTLDELVLDDNLLDSLPENIDRLNQLKTLSLYKNKLSRLPQSLWKLTGLRILNIADNLLSFLPEGLGDLVDLKMLDLGHNRLSALPESVGGLKSLAFLYLSNNHLDSLPASFEKLGALIYLNVTDNQMASFPESISRLGHLIELRLVQQPLHSASRIYRRSNRSEGIAPDEQQAYLPPRLAW